ncbi:hypothetical protein DESC_370253 [Desulfosarcina cetonica]|nr:hypothetical protein DESC_370253 [Desulfosarcina cetonica]
MVGSGEHLLLADQFSVFVDHGVILHDQEPQLLHDIVAVAVFVLHVFLAELVVADDPGNPENEAGGQQDAAGDQAVGDHLLSGIEDEEKDGVQFVKQHAAGHQGEQYRQKRDLFYVGQEQVELEEFGTAFLSFATADPVLAGGLAGPEDKLVESQNENPQQKGDGHRCDEGDIKVELPGERSFFRAQMAQKTHQKNQDFNGDDEPQIIDEKAFELHPVEQGGQSAMFFFFFGTHG